MEYGRGAAIVFAGSQQAEPAKKKMRPRSQAFVAVDTLRIELTQRGLRCHRFQAGWHQAVTIADGGVQFGLHTAPCGQCPPRRR